MNVNIVNEFFVNDDDELFAVMNHMVVANLAAPIENALVHMNLEDDKEPLPRNESYYEETIPRYDVDDFHAHFRMSRRTLEMLTRNIGHRRDLGHEEQLDKEVAFTIWMLAKPESFRACSDRFGYPRSTGHNIFCKITAAICQMLPDEIIWPDINEANGIAARVENKTRFPGVIGMIDGCHIPIKAPAHNPVDYYNRKSFHSVILQGVCNDNMLFTDVFIGMPGKCHDARVFRNSPLYDKIINENLVNNNQHLLGDSAYPLMLNLLTPFRDNGHLLPNQMNYNTILSSIRSKIEQAFARLKGKWRRLKFLDMNIENISSVIAAACVLHNYTLKMESANVDNYAPDAAEMELNEPHPDDDIPENAAYEKRNAIMQVLL
ncbi:hypothetical protein NQ315_003590 [Exocentrus adspersus]|uniref:DDE Tnp4 domain-containing protein n=1 Tax=Exocentrus adspersus TaxID=1586481 RepID=A0AAV8VJW7_9CUCU|nr:hypothetical protein NQ315_003590 [Exocentrus adspersus]